MWRRVLLGLLIVASVAVTVATSAEASCAAPKVREIEPAVRGEVISVQGDGFGDACNDVLPREAGEGPLGEPVPRIELFVAQGDREVLVAVGAANADYRFAVDIAVPPRLSPGPARVVARWGMNRTEQEFQVLADQPVAEPPGTTPIVPFDSVPQPASTPAATSVPEPEMVLEGDAGRRDVPTGALVGGLVAVLAAAVAALWWARRRTT